MKEELFVTGHLELNEDMETGDILCEGTGMRLSELLYSDKFINKKVKVHIEEVE